MLTRRVLPLVLLLGLLTGCGGGGGGTGNSPSIGTTSSTPPAGSGSGGTSGSAQASIAANVSSVSVSASTLQSAPTAAISISAQITGTSEIYVGIATTHNGIASVSGVGGYAVNFTLTFKSPASLGAGTYQDTATIYGCYDQACARQVANSPLTIPVTYTVTQGPAEITSVRPTSTVAGGSGLTLRAYGSGFTPQSVIEWNGAPVATQYVSPIEVDAQLSASDVALPDIAEITVSGPVSDPLSTAAAIFTVMGVSPASTTAGGPKLLLTVVGEGFGPSSVVQWNGNSQPTTLVSASELRAQIDASQIATTGTASVSVQNGGDTGPTNASVSIESATASKDAVAFQINPEHSGSISFDSLSLPATSAWSVDVGGTPSYALIADGRVFVTSQSEVGTQSQSELVALDQATGATVWGPITLPGPLSAAYDNGAVFVSTGAQIQAYDAQTGAMKWSVSASLGKSFMSVVAANGLVYAPSNSNNILTTAFKEDTGLVMWRQSHLQSSLYPTVTVDGVYVSGVGFTADLDPATGDIIWQNEPAYSNGHDTISPEVDGILYSPNTAEVGSDNGTEFDADTGAVLGGFNTYYVPAIGARTGYFLNGNLLGGGTLSAVDLATGTVLWTFTGDGQLMSSPILVDQYVFVESSSGNLYALDAASGSAVWQQNVGATIPAGVGWGQDIPTTGLSAGDGLLVAPAGTRVTAYVLSSNP